MLMLSGAWWAAKLAIGKAAVGRWFNADTLKALSGAIIVVSVICFLMLMFHRVEVSAGAQRDVGWLRHFSHIREVVLRRRAEVAERAATAADEAREREQRRAEEAVAIAVELEQELQKLKEDPPLPGDLINRLNRGKR